MEGEGTVQIVGDHERESEKAVLVDTEMGKIWFPKSQMTEQEGVRGGKVSFHVPAWLARKNGFIE